MTPRSAETTADPEGGADLEKILIELPPGHWTGAGAERVWAKPVDEGLYEVRNSPWHVVGIHWGDVVMCSGLSEAGLPIVRDVVEPSGHLTYRIFFAAETVDAERKRVLQEINELGAQYEKAAGNLYAIDVPSGVDAAPLADRLAVLEEHGVLAWEAGF